MGQALRGTVFLLSITSLLVFFELRNFLADAIFGAINHATCAALVWPKICSDKASRQVTAFFADLRMTARLPDSIVRRGRGRLIPL